MKKILSAVLLLSACGRSGPARDGSVAYRSPDGRFSARLPGDWRADEGKDPVRLAAFFGPPGGPKPYSQSIAVYFHPAADPDFAARLYLASNAGSPDAGPARPPRQIAVGALTGLELDGRQKNPGLETAPEDTIMRTVVAAVPGGFYALEQSRPAGAPETSAFDEMLKTFAPTPPSK